MNSVQIQSFFWSVFSRIWTEYREIRSNDDDDDDDYNDDFEAMRNELQFT